MRRELLDDALALLDAEGARAADEAERVLRQRAALLRQAGGAAAGDVASTLDVWDQRLADAGKILVTARERLVSALGALVGPAYGRLAGQPDRGVRSASTTSAAGPATSSTRWPRHRNETTCDGASTPWGPTATTSC